MKIKNAARTVIIDNDRTAIINVRNGEYFKIPGGGIEDGETPEMAAKREAIEEAGCDVEILGKIGEHSFIDSQLGQDKTLHNSVCYIAKIISNKKDTSFNDWEQSNQMQLIWPTLSEAVELFEKAQPKEYFGQQINKRDHDFLVEAIKHISLNQQ